MGQKKLRGLILLFALFFLLFWLAIFSATNIDAEPKITPTPYYAFWNNLPVVLGGSGMPTPTPTATGPIPTVTPGATPTPTETVSPPELPAPVLFDIDNDDQDGNYTVAWSAVNGADYYRLEQNLNDTTWETVYEGPALSKSRSALPPGIYCYRVRALNAGTYSARSTVKCATVSSFKPPELPAPTLFDIENGDQDGSYTVAWSAVSGADYYKVKQNVNDTAWDTLYQGPALSKSLANMAPGQYCYRVRAFNATAYSEWSPVKCTNVAAGQPPALPAPVIADIENGDQDGSYTVAWSAVAGADYYKVKQNANTTTWDTLYQGPALSQNLSNMAPGQYCYRVRAFNATTYSEWSEDKCTTVTTEPKSDYVCEFETIYEGPRKGSDIELLHDGRLFITETSSSGASIFDPKTRTFKDVVLPQGGGRYAAVLPDGRVLLTVEGNDPHSMIYDPLTDEISRLNAKIDCLDVYSNQGFGLMTYCGDDHGYTYFNIGSLTYDIYSDEYWTDIEVGWSSLETFMGTAGEFRGYYFVPISNGIAGDTVALDEGFWWYRYNQYDFRDNFAPHYGMASTKSVSASDGNIIYHSGGESGLGEVSVTEAYRLANGTLERIADMGQDRAWHEMIGLFDGNVVVVGGSSGSYEWGYRLLSEVEVYMPSLDKWFVAGSLNVPREYSHHVIQLLNGEIFVYGGNTVPGPGYSFDAPTEIGRCELKK